MSSLRRNEEFYVAIATTGDRVSDADLAGTCFYLRYSSLLPKIVHRLSKGSMRRIAKEEDEHGRMYEDWLIMEYVYEK